MNMSRVVPLLALLLSTFVANAAEARLGYVDLQKAIQSTEAGKKGKASLEKELQTMSAEFKKTEEALRKDAEEFEKKAAIMSDAARAKAQSELQRRFQELQQKAAASQMELQRKEREMTKPLIDELRAIIEGLGKERGYEFIVEKNEGAVLYALPGADLTDEVIARFNAKTKKK
jgi:outer membrane protein